MLVLANLLVEAEFGVALRKSMLAARGLQTLLGKRICDQGT